MWNKRDGNWKTRWKKWKQLVSTNGAEPLSRNSTFNIYYEQEQKYLRDIGFVVGEI